MKASIILLPILLLGAARPGFAAEPQDLTPRVLSQRLSAGPSGDEAAKLADAIRAWFGAASLPQGANPKVDGLDVAWAIEAPGAKSPPRLVTPDGQSPLTLTRIGGTDLYAGAIALPEGTAFRWTYEVDGKRLP